MLVDCCSSRMRYFERCTDISSFEPGMDIFPLLQMLSPLALFLGKFTDNSAEIGTKREDER